MTATATANSNAGYQPSIGQLPLGVAILAILIGIFGLFVLVAGVVLIVFGTTVAFGGSGAVTIFGTGGTVAGIILAIVGIVVLAVATGLWDQELWALALACIVLLFYGAVEFFAAAWLGFLVVAMLLVYLAAVSNHFD
ncbi:MAG: hypothetical protein L3K03_00100 [Thermoplasmata archaeon]|nr:hypothetical protein [Thermoplasmata archaeon]